MTSIGPLDRLSSTTEPTPTEQPKLPQGEPDTADTERLQRVMERREGDQDQQHGQGQGDDGEQSPLADTAELAANQAAEWRSAGDQILFSLGLSQTEAPASVDAPRGELAGLVDQVADTVLVGKREDGADEVRITLRGTALEGSELRIARAEGGLQVQIVAVGDAIAVMERHGAQLAGDLANRLGTRVVVEVLPEPGSAGETGDDDSDQRRDGRSRGLEALMAWAAG
jgi:type III secretion system needle length determinant